MTAISKWLCPACAAILALLLVLGASQRSATRDTPPPRHEAGTPLPAPAPTGAEDGNKQAAPPKLAFPREEAENRTGSYPPLRYRNSEVALTATLDKTSVTPGEKVRLKEIVPRSRAVKVWGVNHHVYRLGDYVPEQKRLVNRHPDHYWSCEPNCDFEGILHTTAALHGDWPFSIDTTSHQGFDFEIVPLHLGIYQITAEWYIRGESTSLQSQPVILIVQPPVDEKGKPVVKPEWLPAN